MLINGQSGDSINAADRGFLYGDGVFETIRVINHQLTLWPLHKKRLLASCEFLAIPVDNAALKTDLDEILKTNDANGIVKIIVSRGSGGRGYRPTLTEDTTRIVGFHPLPQDYDGRHRNGVRVKFCEQTISVNSRLAGHKHLGRLDQVLASKELDDETAEGIMVTDDGQVVEGIKSNLFIGLKDQLLTPKLDQAGVAGVMRKFLINRFLEEGLAVEKTRLTKKDLINASEIFLCNSVFGVWPVLELLFPTDNKPVIEHKNVGPLSRLALEFQDEEFGKYQ